MAENKVDVAALVAQMPEVDKPGTASKFTGPAWSDAQKVYDAILGGGRASVMELLGLVKAPDDPAFDNYKAEYVLHGMVVHVGRPGREKDRQLVVAALAAGMADDKIAKPTRGLFIRELQWVGGSESVNALARLVADEDLGAYAIAALTAIGVPATASLTAALSKTTGRHRLAVMQGLGRLEAAQAAPELRRLLKDQDQQTRLTAGWALANLGDAAALDALLKAADGGDDWEKPQQTKACLLLAEKLAAAGKRADARKIYQHLKTTRNGEKEKYVRDAADTALKALEVAL